MSRGVQLLDTIGAPSVGDTAMGEAETRLKASHGDGLILIPEGDWLFDSQVTLDAIDGLTLQGLGRAARIYTTGTNTPLFIDNCDNVIVDGIRFSGSGTAASSSQGRGLYVRNCNNVTIRNCIFEGFGFAGLYLESTSTAHRSVLIENCRFEDNVDAVPSTSSSDIMIPSGSYQTVKMRGNFHIAHASDPVAHGVFAANLTDVVWDDILVSGCTFLPAAGESTSYTGFAVGGTDENPDGSYREGNFKTEHCTIVGCIEEGIKYKNLRYGEASFNFIKDVDSIPEDTSLRGAIFLNATHGGKAIGNTVINSGTSAVRCEGLSTANGGGDGTGRNGWVISDNYAESCGEAAYHIHQLCYDVLLSNNYAYGCDYGIRINGVDGTNACNNVSIMGGVYKASDNSGILFDQVVNLTINGVQSVLNGMYGIIGTNGTIVNISGSTFRNNSTDTGNTTDGMRFGDCSGLAITGNVSQGTSQRYGLSFGDDLTDVLIDSNLFRDNTSGSLFNTPEGATLGTNLGGELMFMLWWFGTLDANPSPASPSMGRGVTNRDGTYRLRTLPKMRSR